MDLLRAIDTALFRAINQGLGSAWLDQVMLLVSDRNTWLVLATLAVATALVRRNKQLIAFCLALGINLGLVDLFTYQVLKPVFARERPCHQLEDVRLVQSRCGSDFGFPSNHAANSMATTVTLALTYRRRPLAIAVAVIAVLVGFSRIYLGVHFPGDVVVGFLVGGLLAGFVYLGIRRAGRRWLTPPAASTPPVIPS